MYHNVFRYEYLTFQTQNNLHKQYIFDTNIIQSEYAFLFPFSLYNYTFPYYVWKKHKLRLNIIYLSFLSRFFLLIVQWETQQRRGVTMTS